MSGRRSAVPAGAAPGRRSSRGGRNRPDAFTLLAVVVPLVTIAALLLTGTDPTQQPTAAPTETDLTRSTLVCPSAREAGGDASEVLVATTEDASGEVSAGDGATSVELAPGRTARVSDDDTVAVTATGALAPGLVASRVETAPLALADCRPGAASAWFTGVGAGARHSSVLELTNVGSGQAVVDVRVLGASGPVDAEDLLGIVVGGGDTVRLDLAATVPRRDELALEVVTARGRVAATVLDRVDRLGRSVASQDWLPAQAAPSRSNTLLGLPAKGPSHDLVLANGGADEVRADVRLLTADSVFVPEGLDEVRVPPGGVARVSMAGVLGSGGGEEATGVQVDSTGPLTATLRSRSGQDLTHAVAGEPIGTPTAVLLPRGAKRLVLGGADGVGVVTVEARDANGRVLGTQRVEVAPDRASSTDLPRRAVQVRVTPERASVSAAAVVSGDGVATVPLRALERSIRVPDARPGLP